MAFSVNQRVKVTDQHSEFRNHLGTVLAVNGNSHQVRLDGFPNRKRQLLLTGQLQLTTLPDPIDYSNAG